MAFSTPQTSSTHVRSQNTTQCSTQRRNNPCLLNSEANAPPVKHEDGYGTSYASLESDNCDFDSARITNTLLQHAIELLSMSLKDFRTEQIQDALSEGGVYSFQAGSETNIEVQIREDVRTIQISSVVHRVKLGEMSSDKMRKRAHYSLLMKMMHLNSRLSRTSCGGRICACGGRYILFRDLPISILSENGMLQKKLDELLLAIRLPNDYIHSMDKNLKHFSSQLSSYIEFYLTNRLGGCSRETNNLLRWSLSDANNNTTTNINNDETVSFKNQVGM